MHSPRPALAGFPNSGAGDPFFASHLHNDVQIVDVRSGMRLEFFFPMPLAPTVRGLNSAFRAFLDFIPDGVLNWGAVGATAEQWKPVTQRRIDFCLSMLTPESAARRREVGFTLKQAEGALDTPGYGIHVFGGESNAGWLNESFALTMTFPMTPFFDVDALERLREFAVEISELLPYRSGYLTPAFLWDNDSTHGGLSIRRSCMKHPGLDVRATNTEIHIGTRIRGAHWLTFIDDGLTGELGGLAALQKQAVPGLTVTGLTRGTMLRAGVLPEIGDADLGIDTPLLRALARMVEPITFFEDPRIEAELANHDEGFARRWERRFFD